MFRKLKMLLLSECVKKWAARLAYKLLQFYHTRGCTDQNWVCFSDVECRDGHGIPKCSPCPSVFFLIPSGPSVRFRVFFGWRVRMSIIRAAEIPKIGKIKAKSVRPLIKELQNPFLPKNVKKCLEYKRCDI